MRKMIVAAACLLFCAMTLTPCAWAADPPTVSVTAEVLADINDKIGLGFTTGWDGSSLDPTSRTDWSETSSLENPWNMGFIVPDGDARTLKSTKNTSLDSYLWVYQYQSNTYSGVNTAIADVERKGSFYDTFKDYGKWYKWAGNKLSDTWTPLDRTHQSVPIHPSYTDIWNFPTKLSLDIKGAWSIAAGEYWAKVTNKWFYSNEEGTTRSEDDHDLIERYLMVAVDKALYKDVGLVFGTKWEGGLISEPPASGSPFTIVDTDWTDGVAYTFYGGLSNFQSNTTTYNKLTIGPAKQASGVDQTTDLRQYISQYFWTGSDFADTGVPTYPDEGEAYVVKSTLQHQSVSCTVPNKFEVRIPVADVFKVGAGTYTASVKSEWSFADHTDFSAIGGATKETSVSIAVPQYYDGYGLPGGGQEFTAVKPGVSTTYELTVTGFQNHNRQVMIGTDLGTGLKPDHFSLEASGLGNATAATEGTPTLGWTGTFNFNNAGGESQLLLTWTFTPDWSYSPKEYTMTVTLTHAPVTVGG